MSRLKYLNSNWIDCHETWCRHLASPYGPNFNLSNIFFINHKPKKKKNHEHSYQPQVYIFFLVLISRS